jgi:hypothetical protein
MFELRKDKAILDAIHDGESTGSIARRLKGGMTCITEFITFGSCVRNGGFCRISDEILRL